MFIKNLKGAGRQQRVVLVAATYKQEQEHGIGYTA